VATNVIKNVFNHFGSCLKIALLSTLQYWVVQSKNLLV
jgi:hypothetical protein